MNTINFKPIGVVHSKYKEAKGMPIQSRIASNIKGTVEIFPEFVEGLKDIEGFSHIILLFYFHLSKGYSLEVKPYMDDEKHGVFATRAPKRPNSIGISIVRLLKVEGNKLYIEDMDILDGTPVLDIKPHVPEFDNVKAEKIGWLEKVIHKLPKTKDDGRFV